MLSLFGLGQSKRPTGGADESESRRANPMKKLVCFVSSVKTKTDDDGGGDKTVMLFA